MKFSRRLYLFCAISSSLFAQQPNPTMWRSVDHVPQVSPASDARESSDAPLPSSGSPDSTAIDAVRSIEVMRQLDIALRDIATEKGPNLAYADFRQVLDRRTDVHFVDNGEKGGLRYVLDGGATLFIELDPSREQEVQAIDSSPPTDNSQRGTLTMLRTTFSRNKSRPAGYYANLPADPGNSFRLPASRTYRLLHGMPGDFFTDITPTLRQWLDSAGYTGAAELATLDELRKPVNNTGIFFFSTHGSQQGYSRNYCLWTATPFSEEGLKANADPATMADFSNGMLAFFNAWYTLDPQFKKYGVAKSATHWCIFPSFVKKYINWSPDPDVSGIPGFSQNSLIFIDACWSKTSYSQDIVDSFAAPGSLYVGWSDSPTQVRDLATIKFLFDRMLGRNQIQGEPPPKRPLDYPSVQSELEVRPEAQPYTIALQGDPNMVLVPTISRMGVDAAQQRLIIEGMFGEDFGESRRTVTIGSRPLQVIAWHPNRIECDLPSDSTGGVVVAVDSRRSNQMLLGTECQGGGACCSGKDNQCSSWPEFDDVSKVVLSLHCQRYEGDPFDATVSVSRPSGCNYWRSSRTLHFGLDNPPPSDRPDYNYIFVNIDGAMSGSGSFQTDPEGNIEVGIGGFSDEVWDFEFDSLADPCKITLQTDLNTIAIPPGNEGKGKVSVQVRCPRIGSAGVECDVSPATFRFSTSFCEAVE